jgi:hypothetical protein
MLVPIDEIRSISIPGFIEARAYPVPSATVLSLRLLASRTTSRPDRARRRAVSTMRPFYSKFDVSTLTM